MRSGDLSCSVQRQQLSEENVEFQQRGHARRLIFLHKTRKSEYVIVVALDIVHAKNYLHCNGIIHCDLKLDKVFVTCDQEIVKLVNFVLAKE